jgi:L-2,4-diaminobutyrate decarboxylase
MKGYDPQAFRRDGHRLIDALADYLERAGDDPSLAVLPPASPGANEAAFPAHFPDEPIDELHGLVGRALGASHHLHSPRYVGHQVTPPHPQAALVALAGALLNNGMAVYEMGPAATAMERSSLRFLASRLGWSEGADGVLTSGGSLGTLTALLAAREARARGEPAGRLCVLASEQAHYCVGRAVHIMGMGEEGLVKVATDERFRLDPAALPTALAEAERRGRRPFALVGSACSTATGAFDPLTALADLCERRGLWFHVDGAHGAAAALSPAHRGLLAGVEGADSVVWDMHKMMLLPALITAVLFREGARSYGVFSQQASYLFGDEKPWWDVGLRTVECTKRSMGMEVYAALRLLGPAALGAYVASRFDLGKRFAAMLREQPDFELATEPDCNIVCFRYRPGGGEQALDALQERVRAAVVQSGQYYLVKTALRGRTFLRTTLIHPHTDEEHLRGLLDAIRGA